MLVPFVERCVKCRKWQKFIRKEITTYLVERKINHFAKSNPYKEVVNQYPLDILLRPHLSLTWDIWHFFFINKRIVTIKFLKNTYTNVIIKFTKLNLLVPMSHIIFYFPSILFQKFSWILAFSWVKQERKTIKKF